MSAAKNRFARILATCFLLALFAQLCYSQNGPQIVKVDPPSWWVGHSINPVRLLIHGSNLHRARVQPLDPYGLIRVATPAGDAWYRYNNDAYGERTDGGAYDGRSGRGRLWTLLTGERGQYEIALRDTRAADCILCTALAIGLPCCLNKCGIILYDPGRQPGLARDRQRHWPGPWRNSFAQRLACNADTTSTPPGSLPNVIQLSVIEKHTT